MSEATGSANEGTHPRPPWTWGRRLTLGMIGLGAMTIAGVGFVGSYSTVRSLAAEKRFGWFADVFPLGIDAGVVVLPALDLALTAQGLRYPLLRWIAWLLTVATIAFNGAASWPDKLGTAMHATIPLCSSRLAKQCGMQ